MRIRNSTDTPTPLLREMVRQVCPPGVGGFDVEVRNSSSAFAGRAYHEGSGYHDRAAPFVVVRIGASKRFPCRTGGTGGYLPYLLLSREEATVHVLAHELRHLWQAGPRRRFRRMPLGTLRWLGLPRPRKGMVWGSRGRFSERDADAYAIRMVRKWRREHPHEVEAVLKGVR